MELYTLDPNFNRTEVVDSFTSLIWTERLSEIGDFEITIASNPYLKMILREGTLLAMSDSLRVMQVQSVEDNVNPDGMRMLTIKGPSLEDILNQRWVINRKTSFQVGKPYRVTGSPGTVCRRLFHDFCILGVLDSRDKYPFIVEESLYPPGDLDEPEDPIIASIEPKTMFDALKEIVDTYWMGFRLCRDPVTAKIYWDIFIGNDLTSSNRSFKPAVIFSPSLDNLQNTTELKDVQNAKNVMYTLGQVTAADSTVLYNWIDGGVLQDSIDAASLSGLARRCGYLGVDFGSFDENDSDALINWFINQNQMTSDAGRTELTKAAPVYAYDGEINEYGSQYKYGVDYNLGDNVELQNVDGTKSTMIVTEQIFASDVEGDKSYPTLVRKDTTFANSWGNYNPLKQWADKGTTEYWAGE